MNDVDGFTGAILGLGLMGGSLAGALAGKTAGLAGWDPQPATVEEAAARGWVDRPALSAKDAVRGAQFVILAAPVRGILDLLDELREDFEPGCLVMDLGSTKRQVLARMETLPDSVEAIGGHPMCGKELSGIGAADPDLFQGRPFLLTPGSRATAAGLALAEALARAAGARPVRLEPERHDALVAEVSHLPYLLACGLALSAGAAQERDPLIGHVAAGGLRDTSRVAGSSPEMMIDILMTNRDAILESVAGWQAGFNRMMAALTNNDEDELMRLLRAARSAREEVVL